MRKHILIAMSLALMLICFSPPSKSQSTDAVNVTATVDTSAVKPTLPIPTQWSVGEVIKVLPDWLAFFASFMMLFVLPAIQFILKRVPTENSVKIQGILGKILDLLTFFQKDKLHPKKE